MRACSPYTTNLKLPSWLALSKARPDIACLHVDWTDWANEPDSSPNLVPHDDVDDLPTDLAELESTSVGPSPCKEPLGPDAKPSKTILKPAAAVKPAATVGQQERNPTSCTASGSSSHSGTLRRRSVHYDDTDGQRSIRFEDYSATSQREGVEEVLAEQLSRRSSRRELVQRRILFQTEVEVVVVDHMTAAERHVDPTWAFLTSEDKVGKAVGCVYHVWANGWLATLRAWLGAVVLITPVCSCISARSSTS